MDLLFGKKLIELQSARHSSVYYLLTPVLAIAMLLWLLNPAICCPDDSTSTMQSAVCPSESYQMPMDGNTIEMGYHQAYQSQSIIYRLLSKGSPQDFPDSTQHLTSPMLTRLGPEKLWPEILVPNMDMPSSAIVLPLEYPPQS